MFKNNRYITRGVRYQVPIEQQLMMWAIIDDFLQKDIEVDYLQVMRLSLMVDEAGIKKQLIKHHQEVPTYVQSYLVSVDNIISENIFIIDDGTNTTMMLASEY